MTNQEVFDKVATHLLTQNSRAETDNGTSFNDCVYRAEDGKKCAVGCLIPDEIYDPEMEGMRVSSLIVHFDKVEQILKGVDDGLLRSLQTVHDRYRIESWKKELFTLAEIYKLDPSVLDKF